MDAAAGHWCAATVAGTRAATTMTCAAERTACGPGRVSGCLASPVLGTVVDMKTPVVALHVLK